MNQALTAVSLFTGAGGMDIGFEKAGVNVIFANELMKEAAETYKANHPGRTIVNDDINNVIEKMNNYEGTDLVFGGPPCQGFSVAGKMDPDDARSKLIFTFLDVVERVKPRAFVMENVKALGFLDKWEPVRKKYLERASRLGYHCSPFILNATEYGVSQKRERVFFIGIKNNQDVFFEYHMNDLLEQQKTEAPTIRALLKSLGPAGTEKNPNTCTAKITFATNPIMRKSPYAGMYFNGQGRPINIDDYAKENHFSTSWFIRNFKLYTGITPKQYILKKRIYNAEALLQNTQYNINEIAQIIGYDNPLYFSRVFQKTKGISPSEYRKNISQRVFNSPSL